MPRAGSLYSLRRCGALIQPGKEKRPQSRPRPALLLRDIL